jgi:hypothetical protein
VIVARKPPGAFTEKEFDALVFNARNGIAPNLGWRLLYHTQRSKGSPAGFPDRVLVRDRVVYAELKKQEKAAKPTDLQRAWLDGLARAGAEVYLWKPADADEIGEILGRRWSFVPWRQDAPPHLASLERGWTPASAWIPGAGRADTVGVS